MNPYKSSPKYDPTGLWYDSFITNAGTAWIVHFGDEYIARVENEQQCKNILHIAEVVMKIDKQPEDATHRGPAGYYRRVDNRWFRHTPCGWVRSDIDERFLNEILYTGSANDDRDVACRDAPTQR